MLLLLRAVMAGALVTSCMTASAAPLVLDCRAAPPDAPDPAFVDAFCTALEGEFARLEPGIPLRRGDAADAAAQNGAYVLVELSALDAYGLTATLSVTEGDRTERQDLSLTSFDARPESGMAASLLLPILRLTGHAE